MSYQRYEIGERKPNVYTAQLISNALGCEVKDIFPIDHLPEQEDDTNLSTKE